MEAYRTAFQLCVSTFAIIIISVLLDGTQAVPSPDPYAHAHADPTGRSHQLPDRRFPSIPVDVYRTKSGELRRVDWDSDAYVLTHCLFLYIFTFVNQEHFVALPTSTSFE